MKCAETRPGPVQIRLEIDLETRAVSLFLSSFVPTSLADGSDSSKEIDLSTLFASAPTSSCLQHYLIAVSRLNLKNHYKAEMLDATTSKAHLQALTATNTALSNPATAHTDECLASVWLLSFFELLQPRLTPLSPNERTPWTAHVSGTLGLLLQRGETQLQTETGRVLFKVLITQILVMFMMGSISPPAELENPLQQAMQIKDFKGAALAMLYMFDIVQLHCDLRRKLEITLFKPGMLEPRQLWNTVKDQEECLDAETLFEIWTHSHPSWQRSVAQDSISSNDQPDFYFSVASHMSTWITVLSTKLFHVSTILTIVILSGAIVEGSSNFEPEAKHTMTALRSRISKYADEILGCLSFAYGDIDMIGKRRHNGYIAHSPYMGRGAAGYQLLFPVGLVLNNPYTSAEQEDAAKEAFKIIGGPFGIRQALRYIDPSLKR